MDAQARGDLAPRLSEAPDRSSTWALDDLQTRGGCVENDLRKEGETQIDELERADCIESIDALL